jgi:zinc transport system ATP-binding protein
MSTLIEIKNLTVTYNKTVALENANMVISKNDFIGVIGPNGGGKTTLLKAILGLQEATSGEILFSDGLKNKGSDIGYLPQVNKFDNKFPITVFEVVLSGLIANNKWFSKTTMIIKQNV